MGFPEEILEDEKRVRAEVDYSNFNSPEQVLLGEGAHNTVLRSPHNYVLKNPDENTEFLRKREENLKSLTRIPWNEVIVVEGEGLVRMDEADLTHKEAVQNYGFPKVIEEDFQMFVELAKEGAVFEDFKPANIGYFHDKAEGIPGFDDVEALPIDLYDCDAVNTEELRLIDFQDITDVYMTGNSSSSGLTGNYDLTSGEAYEATISAIADDPEEIIESDFYGIDDVTRKFYRNNLR